MNCLCCSLSPPNLTTDGRCRFAFLLFSIHLFPFHSLQWCKALARCYFNNHIAFVRPQSRIIISFQIFFSFIAGSWSSLLTFKFHTIMRNSSGNVFYYYGWNIKFVCRLKCEWSGESENNNNIFSGKITNIRNDSKISNSFAHSPHSQRCGYVSIEIVQYAFDLPLFCLFTWDGK